MPSAKTPQVMLLANSVGFADSLRVSSASAFFETGGGVPSAFVREWFFQLICDVLFRFSDVFMPANFVQG